MTTASGSAGPATRYEVSDAVATITLNRPETRNALSVELLDALAADLDRAVEDDAARVVVLTNEGPAFCAGADLRAAPGEVAERLPGVLERVLDAPKPVIGRIAGHCTGGGVGLAAACDVSIAADDVRLGFTEVRLGLAPAVISVVCLPKLRRGDALELFLTGERISAGRAVEVGLLSRAVPAGSLDDAVDDVAGKLLAGGPHALAAAKRLVRTVPDMSRDEAFRWTAALSAELFASAEATAGADAFRRRVPAPWVPEGRDASLHGRAG